MAAVTCSSRSWPRNSASAPTQITLGNGSNDALVLLAEAFLKPGLEAVYSQYALCGLSDRHPGHRRHRHRGAGIARGFEHAAGPRPGRHGARHQRRARAWCSSPTLTTPPAPGCRRAELRGIHRRGAAARDRGARRGVFRVHRRSGPAGRHPVAGAISQSRGVPHLLQGLRTGRRARGLCRQPSDAWPTCSIACARPSMCPPWAWPARRPRSTTRRTWPPRSAWRWPSARAWRRVSRGWARAWCRRPAISCCCTPARMRAQRFDALLRQGIIVRPVGNYQLPEHLRVTLGTVEQNDRFLQRLGSLLASRCNDTPETPYPSSPSTDRRAPAKAPSAAWSPRGSAGTCSTAAPCTGWWPWPACTGKSTRTMSPSTSRWRGP